MSTSGDVALKAVGICTSYSTQEYSYKKFIDLLQSQGRQAAVMELNAREWENSGERGLLGGAFDNVIDLIAEELEMAANSVKAEFDKFPDISSANIKKELDLFKKGYTEVFGEKGIDESIDSIPIMEGSIYAKHCKEYLENIQVSMNGSKPQLQEDKGEEIFDIEGKKKNTKDGFGLDI